MPGRRFIPFLILTCLYHSTPLIYFLTSSVFLSAFLPFFPFFPFFLLSRYYHIVSDSVYRFSPVVLSGDDLKRIHGTDERISIENFKKVVRFYLRLIVNSQSVILKDSDGRRARHEEL
jgi:hypothetical protein